MKPVYTVIILFLILMSCKNDQKRHVESEIDYNSEELDIATSIYPENVTQVFDAHGGLDNWKQMRTLTFTMPDEKGNEVTTTDLYNRSSRIEMPNHVMGFDGENVWLQNLSSEAYNGKPKFYYNLMFYFYAMPFVLADDGIIYEEVAPLEFEGKQFPGIKVSYESGVGESPEDEYILYYDADSHQMEWLAYTVTYFSKEKSKVFRFIKYSEWQTVNGLKLPKTLTWYNYENKTPTTKRNDVDFTDIELTKSKPNLELFLKPENAVIIK